MVLVRSTAAPQRRFPSAKNTRPQASVIRIPYRAASQKAPKTLYRIATPQATLTQIMSYSSASMPLRITSSVTTVRTRVW